MEPLDPELARLVHDGMTQAVPGPEVEQRVLRGLMARLPAGPPGGGDGGPAGPSGGGHAAEPGISAVAGTSSSKAMVLVAVIGGVVIGGAWVGGRPQGRERSAVVAEVEAPAKERTGEAARREPPARVEPAPVEPAPVEPAVVPTSEIPTAASASSEPLGVPRATSRPKPIERSAPDASPPPEPAADALADEIQRIAAADAALARGDAEQALRLAREHATAHPSGQLGVERTAIELSARCQLGQPGATEAAAAFLREHGGVPAATKVRARCPRTNSIEP